MRVFLKKDNDVYGCGQGELPGKGSNTATHIRNNARYARSSNGGNTLIRSNISVCCGPGWLG